nr:HEPN domain-containing protein [Natronospira proteinivora]
MSLRVHRALSWLNRAEQCEDDLDGRFIFLWIAFNAAYANDTGEIRIAEGRRLGEFLERIVRLDAGGRLSGIVWQQYPQAIRVLLDNQFVFQPYWDHLNGIEGAEDWEQEFRSARIAAQKSLARQNTAKILGIVFSRLYTLRNQLVHGGATWNSQVNRQQLADANQILGDLVPVIIEIMMDNDQDYWGEAYYPVVL